MLRILARRATYLLTKGIRYDGLYRILSEDVAKNKKLAHTERWTMDQISKPYHTQSSATSLRGSHPIRMLLISARRATRFPSKEIRYEGLYRILSEVLRKITTLAHAFNKQYPCRDMQDLGRTVHTHHQCKREWRLSLGSACL